MRMLMYITVFLSLVLLPVTETIVHALPWCGCGYCYMQSTGKCTCGYPFYWCLEDLQALQMQAHVNTMPTETESINVVASASTDAAYMIRGGQCLHSRVTLHLLRNVRQEMNFVPVTLN